MSERGRDEVVEEVRAANDIVGVIGGYLRLAKAGRNFKGLCPFHREKTPSFMVSPERQTFHCFGCGKGGDVFRFVMEIEGVPFPEALRTLAGRAGIRLPERGDGRARERKERLQSAVEFAARFYREVLHSPAGKAARKYLGERGITKDTVERFGIGSAPAGWRNLFPQARREGFTEEDLIEAGLLVRPEEGDPYDRFRERILFPIQSVGGRVIGFGGRMLGEGEPKYLNSPETALFRKGDSLYGLSLSRHEIRREGVALLVEGYMDLLSLWQGGFRNVVAPLGTAFTEPQARLVSNYTDRAVILFDSDDAGKKATLRSLETLAAEGVRPEVVSLPDGADPDSYLRSEGKRSLEARIEEAAGLVPYLLEHAFPGEKERGVRAIVAVLASMKDELRMNLLLHEAGERTGIAEDVLHREVVRRKKERREPKAEAVLLSPKARKRVLDAERGIAYLGFEHPDLLPVIRKVVDPERVEDLPARKLLKALYRCEEEGESPLPSLLTLTGVDREFSQMRVETAGMEDPLPTLQDYIACVREEQMFRRMRRIREELKDAEERNDEEACDRLLQERARLAEQRRRMIDFREGGKAADFLSGERGE